MLNLDIADKSERFFGWLSLIVVGLAACAVIAIPFAGLVVGEDIQGNFAYGSIIASILVDVGVVISYGSTFAIRRVTLRAWCAMAAVCLFLVLYIGALPGPDASKTADTVLIVAMSILAFPASLVSLSIVFLYSTLLMADRASGWIDLLFFWGMFAVAGFLQWFVLIPFFLQKFKSKKSP